MPLSLEDKERLKLQKKLREIEKLEQEAHLLPNQLAKVRQKPEILAQLGRLGPPSGQAEGLASLPSMAPADAAASASGGAEALGAAAWSYASRSSLRLTLTCLCRRCPQVYGLNQVRELLGALLLIRRATWHGNRDAKGGPWMLKVQGWNDRGMVARDDSFPGDYGKFADGTPLPRQLRERVFGWHMALAELSDFGTVEVRLKGSLQDCVVGLVSVASVDFFKQFQQNMEFLQPVDSLFLPCKDVEGSVSNPHRWPLSNAFTCHQDWNFWAVWSKGLARTRYGYREFDGLSWHLSQECSSRAEADAVIEAKELGKKPDYPHSSRPGCLVTPRWLSAADQAEKKAQEGGPEPGTAPLVNYHGGVNAQVMRSWHSHPPPQSGDIVRLSVDTDVTEPAKLRTTLCVNGHEVTSAAHTGPSRGFPPRSRRGKPLPWFALVGVFGGEVEATLL